MSDPDFEPDETGIVDEEGVPQGTLLRDFVGFELKLLADGLKDLVLAQLAIVAALIEILFVRRRRGRIFYGLMSAGSRFDHWLRLYQPLSEDDAEEGTDANRILRDAEQRIFSRKDEENE